MLSRFSWSENRQAGQFYDRAEGAGIGKLAAVLSARDAGLQGSCDVQHTTDVPYAETDGNRTGRSLKYTQFGDVAEVSECVDGETFSTTNTYDDSTGRLIGVTYPQVGTRRRLAVGYHYTNLGFLHYVFDEADGGVYWAAKAVNPLGQVTDEYTRNAVETVSRHNPSTGWMLSRASAAHADADKLVQNWTYRYDEGGSVRHRTRADQVTAATSEETFGYDVLDRLTSSEVIIPDQYDKTENFTYDALGNIGTKAGKTYGYGGCSAGARVAGPHAVCTVDGATFSYDDNGNMVSGSGRTITYNRFNKPTHIGGGAAGAVDFIYGADGDRVVQKASTSDGTARTVYVGMDATGKSLYERTTRPGQVEHVQFIYAAGVHGGNAFALRIAAPDGSTSAMKYYHFDHLGSVTAMSDERGQVVDAAHGGADATVMGYDPWGARRDPEGRPASTALNQQVGRREFTGHETITGLGLVNMNGRVYDPVLGRFLSPDPHVQLAGDLQSYNRYTYVTNNPLRYADPTGFFWSELWGGLSSGLGAAGKWLEDPRHLAIVSTVVACAVSEGYGCAVWGVAMALWSAYLSVALDGAPVAQTVMITGMGLIAGLVTGGIASGTGNVWGAMIGGAVSSVYMNTISNLYGGRSLGDNMFKAAAMGAVKAGVGYAFSHHEAGLVSKASGYRSGGGAEVTGGDGVADSDASNVDVGGTPPRTNQTRGMEPADPIDPIYGPEVPKFLSFGRDGTERAVLSNDLVYDPADVDGIMTSKIDEELARGRWVVVVSGLHGSPTGAMRPEQKFYDADSGKFSYIPGVRVVNAFTPMSSLDITGPITYVWATCYSQYVFTALVNTAYAGVSTIPH
jgi:RHS repeat-associated protein